MGIESIRIENFRTCRSVELSNLGHLTVLVGRNGVGKSNILQGIERVAAITTSKQPSPTMATVPQYTPPLAAEITFQAGDFRYHYRCFENEESLSIEESNREEKELIRKKDEHLYDQSGTFFAKIKKTTPCIPAFIALNPTSETEKYIQPALDFLDTIKYYSLEEKAYFEDDHRTVLLADADYLKWRESAEDSNFTADSVIMRLLHMYFDRRDDFDELTSILGSSGLGLLTNIEIIEWDLSPVYKSRGWSTSSQDNALMYFVSFAPNQGHNDATALRLPYENLSYGTRRIIRLLVSIFYDKNSVYLFEQPEDGIHPDLLRKLIDLLRAYSDKGQVIMASHSSELLDWLRPEEVRLVTMTKGETQVRALSDVELEGAKLFLENDGPLSEYLSLLSED